MWLHQSPSTWVAEVHGHGTKVCGPFRELALARKRPLRKNTGFWLLEWRLLPPSLCFERVRTPTNSVLRNLWAWPSVSGVPLTTVYLQSLHSPCRHYSSCLSTTAGNQGGITKDSDNCHWRREADPARDPTGHHLRLRSRPCQAWAPWSSPYSWTTRTGDQRWGLQRKPQAPSTATYFK